MIKYITFDDNYNITQYNDFITNLKNNKIPFKEYVSVKPPHNFYIGVDEKYLPVFLKYIEAPKSIDRWLVEKVTAFLPSEELFLKRKLSDSPVMFEKFISPKIFQDIQFNDYACIFRYKNKEELIKMTRELGIQVWILGKQREWNLAFSYNKFIKNYINLNWILLEKTKPSEYAVPGMFEAELNYKKLVKTKLTNKYINYPYYDNGKYFPLKLTQ